MNLLKDINPITSKCSHSNQGGYERWIYYDNNDNISKFKDSRGIDEEIIYDDKRHILHFVDYTNEYEFINIYDLYGNHIYYKNNKGECRGALHDNIIRLEYLKKSDGASDNDRCILEKVSDIINNSIIMQPDDICLKGNGVRIEFNINNGWENYLEFEFFKDRIEWYQECNGKASTKTISCDLYSYAIHEINEIIDNFVSEVKK